MQSRVAHSLPQCKQWRLLAILLPMPKPTAAPPTCHCVRRLCRRTHARDLREKEREREGCGCCWCCCCCCFCLAWTALDPFHVDRLAPRTVDSRRGFVSPRSAPKGYSSPGALCDRTCCTEPRPVRW